MGSSVKLNDTLQISREQGFPKDLKYDHHKENPIETSSFVGQVFEFKDKPGIRIYQAPPVRNFLVENIDGKWLYWGLVHIIEITHDNINKTTSGKFKIVHIYSPEEMKFAHKLIDRVKETDYLDVM